MFLRLDVHKADMLGRGKFFSPPTNKKRIGCTDRSLDRGGGEKKEERTMQTKTQTQHHANREERTMQTKTQTHHHANTDPNAATNKQKHELSQASEIKSTRVPVFLFWRRVHTSSTSSSRCSPYTFLGKRNQREMLRQGEKCFVTSRKQTEALLVTYPLHPRDLRARALRLLGGRRQRGHESISRSTL